MIGSPTMRIIMIKCTFISNALLVRNHFGLEMINTIIKLIIEFYFFTVKSYLNRTTNHL